VKAYKGDQIDCRDCDGVEYAPGAMAKTLATVGLRTQHPCSYRTFANPGTASLTSGHHQPKLHEGAGFWAC